jgi:endonuclease YncB( thermonuclease family)
LARADRRSFRRRRRRGGVRDILAAFALFAGVALVTAWLQSRAEIAVSGAARIIDGDSLVVDGREMRLIGIDAPEFRQTCSARGEIYPCGIEARNHVRGLAGKRALSCTGNEIDRYDRLLVTCMAGGADLNARIVRDGWALAYGGYEAEEAQARRDGAGVWQGDFERPRDWRARHGGVADIGSISIFRRLILRAGRYFGFVLSEEP